MRIVGVGAILVAVALIAPVGAQQSDQPVSESLKLALQKPQSFRLLIPTDPPWITPQPTTVGILTIASPDRNGEMLKVAVPVGELMTRAAHAISQVRYRRAEKQARAEVQRALQDFLQAQAPER
jgi:hypothetical protein